MVDIFSDALDKLGFLNSELEKARKCGILGETGPHVTDRRRDKQAEEIESIIAMVNSLMIRTEKDGDTSYPMYSFRAMLTALFGSPNTNLKTRVEKLVSGAIGLTMATTKFRKPYVSIYKAAFQAILPEPTVVRDESRKGITAGSITGVGLPVFQLFPAVQSPSELDTSHLLDLNLVVLSARMARTLDAMWNQNEGIESPVKNLVQRAGDLFQDILVTSQIDSSSRAVVFSLLNDISRMIEILEAYISDGVSTELSFITSLDREWCERRASGWKPKAGWSSFSSIFFLRLIDFAKAANSRIGFRPEHQVTQMFRRNNLSVDDTSRKDLTFGEVAKKMEKYCTVEKFCGTFGRQTFSSGSRRREGSYANVRRVRLDEERSAGHGWRFNEVAVKVLRRTGPEHVISLRAFREFIIWSQMKHPNIVPLIGLWFDFGYETGLPAFVSPWIEHGSLSRYLSNRPNMDRAERLHLLLGVANALAYMHNHQPCVCHGDINPENILVSNGDAFVCDFGISHISEPYRGLTTDPHGDWRYRAPEQLLGESTPTPQSDMYSFGLLCYKVLTCLEPWHAISEAGRLSNPHVIMPCPDSMLADDYELLVCCWMTDPRLRATATIAVRSLDELVE
ncbi:hypothetical protein ACEPAI_4315 [Sanghuangporus weigelae]